MKIAFDAKRALNNATGLGNHARILLNAMMRDFPQHDYSLFSPKANDAFFHQLSGDFQLYFPEKKIQKAFPALWRTTGLCSELMKQRTDIYHGLSNEIPVCSKKNPTARVVTIHDLIFLKHKEQYPFVDRIIYEWKTRYAARNAEKIIAVSEESKKDLMIFYAVPESKIEVIYPSVDKVFQLPVSDDKITEVKKKYGLPEKFVLNVGSFFPRKNHVRLIEAFHSIASKIEEDLVLISSGGPMSDAINAKIQSLKLGSRVDILSSVPNYDLPAIFRCASLFVFPSLFEGFGAPVLEALFSEAPVITTKESAMAEAAGKDSVLIDPNSSDEIAEGMLHVLSSYENREQMKASGLRHAQTMTDEIFAKETMRVYESL